MLKRQKLATGKRIDFNSPVSLQTPEGEEKLDVELLPADFDTAPLPVEECDLSPDVRYDDDSAIQAPIVMEPVSMAVSMADGDMHPYGKSKEKDYQDALIVRQALDFDERQFRDNYVRTESEIILKMRKDIDQLYDWLDRLVADLTKSLNTFQETKKTSIEDKLRVIRDDSVRADAINRSIQNFLSSIQHAYQHTFAAFLDSHDSHQDANE